MPVLWMVILEHLGLLGQCQVFIMLRIIYFIELTNYIMCHQQFLWFITLYDSVNKLGFSF